MIRPGRAARLAAAAVAATTLGACTGGVVALPNTPPSPLRPSPTVAPGLRAAVTAQPNPLCSYPNPRGSPPPSPTSLPAPFQKVADQVEQLRKLTFIHPVAPEAVSQQELNDSIRALAGQSLPAKQVDGEGQAWIAMGVIPKGTDLRAALLQYYGTQILGYYDSDSKRLVFSGTATEPTPYQRFVLSHEMTHALDDQRLRFGPLVDRIDSSCQDERSAAFHALIEGDAVTNSVAWAERFLSSQELAHLNREASAGSPPPASIPPFVLQQEGFPYSEGVAFVRALLAKGGQAAVDAAFRSPPVSTEQILHPGRYPSDLPVPVRVPDLSSRLGKGWHLIDQLQPGEEWLRLMLALHLPKAQADAAATGWGGAEYRGWGNGAGTAVLMETIWDSAADAAGFASAVRGWLPRAGTVGMVEADGLRVKVVFGSDRASMARLRAAAG